MDGHPSDDPQSRQGASPASGPAPADDARRNADAPGQTVQLRLLSSTTRVEWRLDERTRAVGRRGVAQAREILRRAHPPRPEGRKAS